MLINNQLFESLVNAFRKLPGVGKKTAERYAMHILASSDEEIEEFINTISNIKKKI